jgi:TPR repeat protein
MCYYNGIGVTPDLDKALSWLNKAAEEKDARAQLLLAEIYAKDNRCKDKDKALFWFCEAAKHDMIRDAELKKFVLVPPYYDQVPPQPQLWYKVILHFSDIDMLCIFPLKDQHIQILHDEVEKLREAGDLTEEEIKTGVYGEGVVDCIDWNGYVNLYETTQMRYEYPVSIDLEHPLTRNELDFYPPAPDPLTEEGFQKLLEKAKQGDVIAMSQVADCYKCGNGTERNKEQMIYWGNKYLDSINNR